MKSTIAEVAQACAQACKMIAPTWPLTASIAVNPHWQRVGRPVRQVAARMAVLAGVQVLLRRPTCLTHGRAVRIKLI